MHKFQGSKKLIIDDVVCKLDVIGLLVLELVVVVFEKDLDSSLNQRSLVVL